MNFWFFVVSCLFVMATGKDNKIFSFSPNDVELSRCIENELIKKTHQRDKWMEGIAGLTARRFLGKTIERKTFNQRLRNFYLEISKNRIVHNLSTDRFSPFWRKALKQAVENCAESVTGTSTVIESKQPKISSITMATTDNDVYIFSPNKTVLSECIKNHLSINSYVDKQVEVAEAISEKVARRFFGKTMPKAVLKNRIMDFFHQLNITSIKYHSIDNTIVPSCETSFRRLRYQQPSISSCSHF